MPTPTWNLEWLNHNSQRRYPLTDDATATDSSGDFQIPNDFLVGLDLPVHAGLDIDPAKFFVLHIGAYATGYSVIVGYQSSGGPVPVATALIARQAHTRNQVYTLGGIGDFVDTVGKVTIGRLDNIDKQPAGYWSFELTATRIEPDAIRPIIRGISSLVVVNGTERSQKLYGDIELVAGTNIQLVPIVVSGEDPQIRINAIEGEGLVEECVCDGEVSGQPILRINGIPPTAAGDFTLLGDECLQWDEIANGLQARDLCSKPCCGCEELEAITRDLEQFGSKATTLENFLVNLQARVTQMDQVVLGSKLSDRGCIVCE